jgi:hypothetical protein
MQKRVGKDVRALHPINGGHTGHAGTRRNGHGNRITFAIGALEPSCWRGRRGKRGDPWKLAYLSHSGNARIQLHK